MRLMEENNIGLQLPACVFRHLTGLASQGSLLSQSTCGGVLLRMAHFMTKCLRQHYFVSDFKVSCQMVEGFSLYMSLATSQESSAEEAFAFSPIQRVSFLMVLLVLVTNSIQLLAGPQTFPAALNQLIHMLEPGLTGRPLASWAPLQTGSFWGATQKEKASV